MCVLFVHALQNKSVDNKQDELIRQTPPPTAQNALHLQTTAAAGENVPSTHAENKTPAHRQ